jgi:hypothetical protein
MPEKTPTVTDELLADLADDKLNPRTLAAVVAELSDRLTAVEKRTAKTPAAAVKTDPEK